MKIIGVIPARFGSTRYPGKPLILIAGKPLLQWVIEGARQSRLISEVLVATDDARISSLCETLGVEAVMTASDLPTGSDRVWAAVGNRPADIVVNIQGDEPLISGDLLDQLVEPLKADAALDMSTLGRPLATEEDLSSVTTAKIVLNHRDEALYFSRLPIPFTRTQWTQGVSPEICLKHIGLYGYRKAFLKRFCEAPVSDLERAESLEQLRALYLGARIKVVRVQHESWGVDTPDDVIKVERLLRGRK
jgi:3-deoxy-manno-octulosonate cytidylyltransferase (CMP-KDO synthetase)